MMSVNRMNAQIKLNEIWKSLNIKDYTIKTCPMTRNVSVANTRACTKGYLCEQRLTMLSKKTFRNEAIHIWNLAPDEPKQCESL